jgi:hypothetical protein
MTQNVLEHLETLLTEISPAPWFSNGYSGTYCPDINDAYEEFSKLPIPPRVSPPCDNVEGYWAFNEWKAKEYALDTTVCWVPAEYGDTATGKHISNSCFIELSRNAMPDMLKVVRAAEDLIDIIDDPAPNEDTQGDYNTAEDNLRAALKKLKETNYYE